MADPAQSYTDMEGDVEAVGAHCQLEYCHVLDFLPFKCSSCQGTFCLDHRSEYAHKCPKEGEWARRRNALENGNTGAPTPKPSLYDHDQQCADLACKTLINTPRMPAIQCTTCNRSYCLKHRMQEEHNCKNLKPLGARPQNLLEQQRDRGLSALGKLKQWSAKKREEDAKKKSPKSGLFGLGKKTSSAAADALVKANALKKVAKGDASIPQDKRIYLYVEASADTTKSKYPSGKFFYNKEWTVGRVLDVAAKALQVENVNNRGGGEEEKLRVFHVEGGRLLKFSEKVGAPCANGNMLVLLRGVGDGEPDLIDL